MTVRSMRRTGVVLGVTALAASTLAACGGSDTSVKKGSAGQELKGVSVTVGSKEFTEQLVLGQLAVELLKAHGASVTDKTNIQGTAATRKALTSGKIDLYWGYTGTAWITFLKHTKPIPDSQKQYKAVKKEDLKKNNIVWYPPAPFNNTYAIAIRKSKAAELGVETVSDVAALAKKNPKAATFCIESEFSTRDDGMPGLEKAYDMDIPKSNIKKLQTGVVYKETKKGEVCNFGEVYTTDGRIQSMNLKVLKDDKHFFPLYNGSVAIRKEVAKKYPKIKQVVATVAPKLTNDVMQKLNGKVDVKGYTPKMVAHDWLKKQGIIKE